jgi:transposase
MTTETTEQTELVVETETVEDIPLLLAQMRRMGIADKVDEVFPAHGNWAGLSPGLTLVVWLAHLMSRGDHRLNYVRPWVEEHRLTLQGCLGVEVRDLDFTDDRLGLLLTKVSQGEQWAAFEAQLNRDTVRVYDLRVGRVRLDSTSVSGYWQVTPDGLIRFGQSKDHRPDLPQLKVMLGVLDPLGMPLVTQVIAGHRADDRLYVPVIAEMRQSVGASGLTYVGDVKMAAVGTRAFIVAGGDTYLAPLAQKHLPAGGLTSYLEPVLTRQQALTPITRPGPEGTPQKIAEGYELGVDMTGEVAGQPVTWTERRLVVRSLTQAAAQRTKLARRLQKAEQQLQQCNVHGQGKKRYTEVAPLAEKVTQILTKQRVADLLTVTYREVTVTTPKGTPKPMIQVSVTRNAAAIQRAQDLMGWRVYATNVAPETLSLEQVVLAYRQAYIVERDFERLKNRPLSISPMYLSDQAHIQGLVHVLSLALRVLTVVEHVVRRNLTTARETLMGLNRGSPKRTTARPTTERLLEAFQGITLSVVKFPHHVYCHLTPLSPLQLRIIELLDLPDNPYAMLAAALPKLVPK